MVVAVAVAVAVIVLKRWKLLCFKGETQNPDLNPANSTVRPLMGLNDKVCVNESH